jgi:predicted GIY-YIG superfamily endonuclease
VYVGHTTNFVQRKHAHKQNCINIKSLNYKCKVYEAIRNNGGWDNWTMEIINFFNCSDHYEARKKEQEYFISLNATLNSIEPMPNPKIKPIKVTEPKINNTFYCEKCNIHCNTLKLFEIHNNTKKHNVLSDKKTITTENTKKHEKKREKVEKERKLKKKSHFCSPMFSYFSSIQMYRGRNSKEPITLLLYTFS